MDMFVVKLLKPFDSNFMSNNCSRSHLTGKYSGTMMYMQYLVSSGGASSGSYVSLAKPNEHPQPYGPAYSFYYTANGDGFGGFGLRLDYLINTVIPQNSEAERYNDLKAISQILLNYEQWLMLDTYGAAPITEALLLTAGTGKLEFYDPQ